MTSTLQHWIDDERVEEALNSERIRPADRTVFTRSPVGSKETVDHAVAAARGALADWRARPVEERCSYVRAMADWLVQRYGDPGEATPLKKLISEEVGKPIAEADIEVIETSDFLRYFSDVAPEALKIQTPKLDQTLWPTKRAEIHFEPVGVVGIIKPWNYPLEMIGWSLGPALVCGNTCVIKPSEASSLTADTYAHMAADAKLPKGVLNIVFGDATTGQALASHRGVDMISFTGSARAGRYIARTCADRLARVSLELSGNDAAIVLPDADLELAANGLVWGAFCNAGQVCVGIKRAYVANEIYEPLLKLVVEKTRALQGTRDFGPIISERQRASVDGFVQDALAGGAKALTGARLENDTLFYQPTVLVEVPREARLFREECFGPVLPIVPVASLEEAITLANESEYGLGASVWTANLSAGESVASRLQVGMVWINDVNIAVPQAPWLGIKQSGLGIELSTEVVREYTRRKVINAELSAEATRAWWYPYDAS